MLVDPGQYGPSLEILHAGLGVIVIVIWSLAGGQGPSGSSVVKVRVTEPAAISPAEGVY